MFIINSNNSNNKLFFNILLILFVYFIWMDIALFFNLQKYNPLIKDDKNNNSNDNNILLKHSEISVFRPLTIKLIMVDHMSHYVHDVVARFLEDNFYLTSILPWLTANFVSLLGLLCACLSGRLLLSDKLNIRRLGCLLFELRNFADSLDGVVFRAKAKRFNTYESIKGTVGYNVDVICDGLGGTIFCICILIRFLRYPPYATNNNRHYLINEKDTSSIIKLTLDTDTSSPSSSTSSISSLRTNYLSSKYIKIICWAFGIRLLCTSLVWDNFVVKYHELLEVYDFNNPSLIVSKS
jgi:hypothetical protein